MADDAPFKSVETSRLGLRCVRRNDAVSISTLMTPGVSRWVASWPVPFTVHMATERIAADRGAAVGGKAMPCVIERRSDDAVLGWIGVARRSSNDRSAALGYWLGERYHGQGYMREAATAVIKAAFGLLDLESIEATVHPDNSRSIAIVRACGMKLLGERTIFAAARDRDEACHVYGITRPIR